MLEDILRQRFGKWKSLGWGHAGAGLCRGTRCGWMAGSEHVCGTVAGWRGEWGQTFEDNPVLSSEPLLCSRHCLAQPHVFNVEFLA